MSWASDVVSVLCRMKRLDPLDFDGAWRVAMRNHPPRGRDLGEYRPTLLPEPGDAENVVEFTRRVCEDAWYRRPAPNGRPSRLRELDAVDGDAGAPRRGQSRAPVLTAEAT